MAKKSKMRMKAINMIPIVNNQMIKMQSWIKIIHKKIQNKHKNQTILKINKVIFLDLTSKIKSKQIN